MSDNIQQLNISVTAEKNNPESVEDALSLKNTLPLRFTLVMMIFVYHSDVFFDTPKTTYDLGLLSVTVFFFLSGYGLEESLRNKKGYLKRFMEKRIPSILIPFWVQGLIGVVVTALFLGNIDFLYEISRVFFAVPHWYVLQLLTFYLVFYFCNVLFRERRHITLAMLLLIPVTMILMGKYFLSELYLMSGLGFLGGVLFSHLRNTRSLKKENLRLIPVLIFFILLFTLVADYPSLLSSRTDVEITFSFGHILYIMSWTGLRTISFTLLLIMLYMRDLRRNYGLLLLFAIFFAIEFLGTPSWLYPETYFAIGSICVHVTLGKIRALYPLLKFGGEMSFEIYLLHWIVFVIVSNMGIPSYFINMAVSFMITMSLAFISFKMSSFILDNYKRSIDGNPA